MIRAIALTGPTAVGKTALSLSVAARYGCEILSLDSMQVYRGMDIGTAKIPPADRAGIPHHLLDICEPTQDFSAADYAAAARPLLQDVSQRGNLPLFVGGTGLYLATLMRGEAQTPPADAAYHAMRMAQADRCGADVLYEELCRVDPDSAAAIHKNNVRRVIRALEIFDATGIPKSRFDRESRACAPQMQLCHMTLTVHNREALYRRADARVDRMLADGLIDEVRTLYERGILREGTTAAQAIGYKEVLAYVTAKASLSDCTEALKLSTRHYIKRQLTWFSHCEEAYPLLTDTTDGVPLPGKDVLAQAEEILQANGFFPTGT